MRVREKRRFPRMAPSRKIPASLGSSSGVQVLNLSPAGAMIEQPGRLSPRDSCTLSLHLAEAHLRLGAQVTWSQIYSPTRNLPGEAQLRFRAGLAFLPLSEAAEVHLRQYLATLKAAPQSPPTSDSQPPTD